MQLGQILINKHWIAPQQLEQAIELQAVYHLKLGEVLIQQGLLAPSQLEDALKEQNWRRTGFWVI